MPKMNVGGHEVNVTRGVAQPATPEGDEFFGLTLGSNGTAATTRRKLVGATRWECHNGKRATGLTLVPPSISCSSEAPVSQWGLS